jgi:hypothetical protein
VRAVTAGKGSPASTHTKQRGGNPFKLVEAGD